MEKKLTRDQLAAIRVSMNAALEAVASEHGLSSLKCANCSFDPAGNFTMKVDGIVAGGLSADAKRYESRREYLGIKMPPLGWTFTNSVHGRTFSIVGMNKTCSKVIAKCAQDGKDFVFSVDYISTKFAAESSAAAV